LEAGDFHYIRSRPFGYFDEHIFFSYRILLGNAIPNMERPHFKPLLPASSRKVIDPFAVAIIYGTSAIIYGILQRTAV